MVGILFLTVILILSFSCTEVVYVSKPPPPKHHVHRDHGPPGRHVASHRLVENGKRFLRRGRCDKAIHMFEKALRIDPGNFSALYWIGVAEGMCGHYGRSYDRLLIALRHAPSPLWRARVYATLGVVLIHMGRRGEAHHYFERAVALDPGNEVVFMARSRGRVSINVVLRWMD